MEANVGPSTKSGWRLPTRQTLARWTGFQRRVTAATTKPSSTPSQAIPPATMKQPLWKLGTPKQENLCRDCLEHFKFTPADTVVSTKLPFPATYAHKVARPRECVMCEMILGVFDKSSDPAIKSLSNGFIGYTSVTWRVISEGANSGTMQPVSLHITPNENRQGQTFFGNGPRLYFSLTTPLTTSGQLGLSDVMQHMSIRLDTCLAHHVCNTETQPFKPRRLLQVSISSDQHILYRLIQGDEIEGYPNFSTLSHRWGALGPTLLLTPETEATLRHGARIDSLPATFRDAALTTYKLGLSYLWIDSLCIIQGDNEASRIDWTDQVQQMHLVYLNSTVTIAALDSGNASEGFLAQSLPTSALTCMVPIHMSSKTKIWLGEKERIKGRDKIRLHFVREHVWTEKVRYIEEAPLNQRAWVLQERLLSPRILYFGQLGVFWECGKTSKDPITSIVSRAVEEREDHIMSTKQTWSAQLQMIDGSSLMQTLDWYPERRPQINEPLEISFNRKITREPDTIQFMQSWKATLETYTACSLTQTKDRLFALTGIAARFERVQPGLYNSGLWLHDLHRELLWCVHETSSCPLLEAPSWTWGSIIGKIEPFGEFEAFESDSIWTEHSCHHVCKIDKVVRRDNPSTEKTSLLIRGHLIESFAIATCELGANRGAFPWVHEDTNLFGAQEAGFLRTVSKSVGQNMTIVFDRIIDTTRTEVDLLPILALNKKWSLYEREIWRVEGLVVTLSRPCQPTSHEGHTRPFVRIGRFTATFEWNRDFGDFSPKKVSPKSLIWAWLRKSAETEIVLG